MESPFPAEMQAQLGHKKKTHRGRRSRGKGAKAHHADGKTHLAAAQAAPTATEGLSHLFKAVRSFHQAKAAETAPPDAP